MPGFEGSLPRHAGTTTVLKSVAKAESVKRVILTSTVGTISPSNKRIPDPSQPVYTHESWNEYDTIERAYYLSKVPPFHPPA